MALGDDILAIAKDKQEAEKAIEAFKKLENSGLAMNVSKTQIISEGEAFKKEATCFLAVSIPAFVFLPNP